MNEILSQGYNTYLSEYLFSHLCGPPSFSSPIDEYPFILFMFPLFRNDNWPSLQESRIVLNMKAMSIEKVRSRLCYKWFLATCL